jgi:hypothetical protein
MHLDHSKTDKGPGNGDGVRRKRTRWGGSDPILCGYPAAQTLSASGVATARAFSDFAALSSTFQDQNQNQI